MRRLVLRSPLAVRNYQMPLLIHQVKHDLLHLIYRHLAGFLVG